MNNEQTLPSEGVGEARSIVTTALDPSFRPRYLDSAETTITASFLQSEGPPKSRAVRLDDGTQEANLVAQWMAESLDNRPVPYADMPALNAYRAAAMLQVDLEAERARLKFITPGAGMSAVYLAKYDEAKECKADPNPSPEKYPILSASIGSDDGSTLQEVMETVIAVQAKWRFVAGAIEGIRLRAKSGIAAATNMPEIQAIRQAIVWPKP